MVVWCGVVLLGGLARAEEGPSPEPARPNMVGAYGPWLSEKVLGDGPVHVDDPHALVLSDNGWAVATLTWPEVDRLVQPHVEWHLHRRRGLAQGRVAGVPAKLWMEDERVLLITQTAYADELAERLR